jgi:hypothetical protein
VFAGDLGIYGNCVGIDHGLGGDHPQDQTSSRNQALLSSQNQRKDKRQT